MEPDDLYTLRNHFWLGNYQMAIQEAQGLTRINAALHTERDEFLYRSYTALGRYNVVIEEIDDGKPVALQAVKLLATLCAQPESKEIVLLQVAEWLSEQNGNPTLALVAAIIYSREGMYRDAVKAIHLGTTMEMLAMLVQVYIAMDRLDLARKQHRLMSQADDDCTLTQLASAWINVATGGGAKYEEAAYTFEELGDKYVPSPMLLNGLASAKMHMGQYEAAKEHLVEAASKSQTDPDTIVNTITCDQHLGKPQDVINRHLKQLREVAPSHPYVAQLAVVEGAFDRAAARFAISG